MTNDVRTSSSPPKTKIFVGRLPENAQSADLRRLFEKYGVVTECDILNRYGFVHMKTEEMALTAIRELNDAEFMGVHISVEQSTGKKSGGRGGRGGGPMRSRGGRGGMGRGPSYGMRGDFDRRPAMPPPPPTLRNGYYDSYDRGYDYYSSRIGASPLGREREPERRSAYPDLRSPYERRTLAELPRSPYDRPLAAASFERRNDYPAPSRMSSDMYRRRTPPPASSYGGGLFPFRYERDIDLYGAPARRYPAPSALDRELPPRRF